MPVRNISTSPYRRPADVKQLYERYRHELRRFFEVRGRVQQADDLTQQMFLELTRRPPPPQLLDAQGYLFQVAWNALNALGRRERREPPQVSLTDTRSVREHTRPFGMLWVEDDSTTLIAQESFNRGLRQLPRAIQVAVLRQFRDGWTYRQIADELDCTTHAVKKYISRALLHFRKQMTDNGTSQGGT